MKIVRISANQAQMLVDEAWACGIPLKQYWVTIDRIAERLKVRWARHK